MTRTAGRSVGRGRTAAGRVLPAGAAGTPAPPVGTLSEEMLADSPAFFYRLQDAGSTAVDASPNGRNGTHGASYLADGGPGGDIPHAVQANDNADVIASPYSTSLTDFTVAALFRWAGDDGAHDKHVIASKNSYYATATTAFPFDFSLSPAGLLQAEFSTGNDFANDLILQGASSVGTAAWRIAHATYDRDGQSAIYLDGVEVDSAPSVNISSSSLVWAFMRASQQNGGGTGRSWFRGPMAYTALFPAALSAERIAVHAQAFAAGS